ncbi:MAG: outer membrane protein transport protein [Zhongshania sp.]|uniref:OmpP1/FadL family transporter n=1 Tax=Zhongshania sp. TaxID=1971902 RepID=UPI0026269F2B|nr:outer membrane protein transport protein [Zhongshania sp.]MDF1690768.1 outer membrane protein transport protein [Zhongshania sp.]
MTRTTQILSLLLSCQLLAISASTHAGLGSYLNGAGATNRALSGAGVAFAEDSMVIATNPAGILSLEKDGWVLGSIFLSAGQTAYANTPAANSQTNGAFVFAPGQRRAEPDVPAEVHGVFPVPFGAIHHRVDERNAIGLAVYGNGGININYKAFDNPNCPANTPQQGYLCFGDTGSDIAQIFIAPTWSHQLNERLRIGISPELIYQTIEVNGFQLFSPASSAPDKLSNNGHSQSFGYGIKAGASLAINNKLTAGLTLQSKGYMQKHQEYRGLLAEQGDLDIAPYLHYGLAWQANPSLTVLVDYQRIYFSKVKAYANSGSAPGLYGDDNGPGFGWSDLSVLKLGLHYRVDEQITLRFGYSDVHKKPLNQQEIINNLISTAVFDEHYNAGISWSFNKIDTIDLTFNYVPKQTINGNNPLASGQQITLSNKLASVDVAWRKAF